MNTQPIERSNRHRLDGKVEVHSIFYTLQGEGPFVGQPAIFVRLAGCNLQCPMCDTDYTSTRELMLVDQVVTEVNRINRAATLVVITGGEPFRQRIALLVLGLLRNGYFVQVETNGTVFEEAFPYYHDRVTVVCSPKTGQLAKEYRTSSGAIQAFKYVLNATRIAPDGLPRDVLGHPCPNPVARPPIDFEGVVYLQPADEIENMRDGLAKGKTLGEVSGGNQRNRAAVVQSCLQHGYTLCLQIHKQVGLE